MCDSALNDADFLQPDPDEPQYGNVECWLYDFRSFMLNPNNTQIHGLPAGFPVASEAFMPALQAFWFSEFSTGRFGSMESYGNKWGRQIGLINNNGQLELKWMSITMQSMLRLRAFELPQKLQKDYDQIQEFVDQFNGQGPQGVNRAYQYADNKWTHMHKQNLFLELAMMGMIVGPLMAFVVIFIATTNIILAGSALATIAMIL